MRQLLDGYKNYEPLSDDDLKIVMDVTETTGIIKAWKQPNPRFPNDTRHLYAEFYGVAPDSWSWKKAITRPHPMTQFKKVLRDAIAPDLKDFMATVENAECQHCGTVARLTVDHVAPPFDLIANRFIEQNGVAKIVHSPDGVGNIIQDADIEAAWIAFHAAHAVYQVLCVSCNASKGKR